MRSMHLIAAPLVCAFALSLAGCNAPAQSAIDTNKSLWAGARPAKYQYNFRWSCFCGPDFTEPVKITVENNQVTQVIVVATGQPAARPADYRTIDGLFSFLQDAVDRNADQINATYDARWGFPKDVSIDYVANAADEEMAFSASDLVMLP